jgi:hypothetical protein
MNGFSAPVALQRGSSRMSESVHGQWSGSHAESRLVRLSLPSQRAKR